MLKGKIDLLPLTALQKQWPLRKQNSVKARPKRRNLRPEGDASFFQSVGLTGQDFFSPYDKTWLTGHAFHHPMKD